MSQINEVKNIDTTANPAPLGLCAFALTTLMLNIHNAGFFELDTTIMVMGLFYGGLAQIIVGIMEWKKNNTFGTLAFTSYGLFWWSLVGIFALPAMGVVKAPSDTSIAFFLGVWELLSFFLLIATFKLNKALQVTFATLNLLFILLITAKVTGNHHIHVVAGYVGIVCALSAFYTGIAQVINEVYKKTVMPIN